MTHYDSIKVGDRAEKSTLVTLGMVDGYAKVTGDNNPVHVDEVYAASSFFKKRVAHGMLVASFISALLGTRIPGPGAIYLNQSLEFKKPVFPGDQVTASVEVVEKEDRHKKVRLKTLVKNQDGVSVLEGEAWLLVR